MKVTVVVPVYNPGASLEGCIASILGQTLAPDEFEAIFVDDGSTDASPGRLDQLAADHPNMRVVHQPNSGWPGKPRNVGIDAARGTYIYFVDHDDVLGPEALSRLYEFAEQNRSDIVIGKMAGHGRTAPKVLFLETRGTVTLEDSGIIGALSPHKLFRTSFLRASGLRFAEGRRRLEDQLFVVQAYFAAGVISILSDYTCYYHLAPEGRSNAATGQYDPAGRFNASYYYPFLREVLDVIEANTEPGPLRDKLLRRFVTRELVGRLAGPSFVASPPARRKELFAEVSSTIERYVPASVDPTLPPGLRVQLALVRAGRLDLLGRLARTGWMTGLAVRLHQLRLQDGRRLLLDTEVELVHAGRPLVFGKADGELLIPLPSEVAAAVPADARSIPMPIRADVHVVLRRRRDSAEIILRTTPTLRLVEVRGGVRVLQRVEMAIDLDTPAEGGALRSGRWDLIIRMHLAGYRQESKVRQRTHLGRTRQAAIQDAEIAATRATWSLRAGSGLVARAAATRPMRRILGSASRSKGH